MEPNELTQAMNLLGDYERDNRKLKCLKLGLSNLNIVIEGEYGEKYINIAKNIKNKFKSRLLDEARNLKSNLTSIYLAKVDHMLYKIKIFLEANFDENGDLNSLNEEFGRIRLMLNRQLTPEELKVHLEMTKLFDELLK